MIPQTLIHVAIALLLSGNAFSQPNYTVSYYPFVYRAELNIVENRLNDALEDYKTAFEAVDRIFSIDLVNATVCAIQVDSISKAMHLLRQLILKGVSRIYLSEFKGFDGLRGRKEWNELLSNYDDLRSSVEFDDSLYTQLDSITGADQHFRIAPGSYALFGDTIVNIDRSNILFLREVMGHYGFPNEHILGVEYPDITFPGEIVFHHYFQRKSLDEPLTEYDFESDFYHAVQVGELDPHRMAQLLGLQGKYAPKIGQNTVILLSLNGVNSQPFREKVNKEMISGIDENRARAGLENQAEFYQKAVFKLFDSRALDYEFKRYSQTEIFDVDEATYHRLLNALEPIDIR